ncbi:MAG: carbon dioxide concentrating mechanism protein CcmL [Planctomycetota bacterium]|nr:MAG: carbon dioxide concentrating mechanism protein CcmL [Planctomycetota bacterium]
MRIGKIIGNVALSRAHPSMAGTSYRLVTPLAIEHLYEETTREAEPFVVYDELSAGDGDLIAISEGGEAAQPFKPELKPVDAYNAAILDQLNL